MSARLVPCADCGKPRPQSGAIKPGSVCAICYRAKQKQRMATKIAYEQVQDKAAKYPTSSWWACTSREQFNANLAREMPRLMAIGASIPKTQQPLGG